MGAVPHKRARGENNSEYEDRLSTQHDRACERLTPRPVADAVTSEMPGIDCPACGERVARGSLREHLIKLHGRKPGQFLAKAPPAGGVKNRGTDSENASHAGDRTVEVTSIAVSTDGTAGLATFAREGGRFGSHPEFDGDNN
jgi:hypothetical protein